MSDGLADIRRKLTSEEWDRLIGFFYLLATDAVAEERKKLAAFFENGLERWTNTEISDAILQGWDKSETVKP